MLKLFLSLLSRLCPPQPQLITGGWEGTSTQSCPSVLIFLIKIRDLTYTGGWVLFLFLFSENKVLVIQILIASGCGLLAPGQNGP